MEIRRISGALGAEIVGVDLTRASEDLIAELRAAWLDHLVLFFRDQHLSPADFLAFAGRFGDPMDYPFLRGLAGFPQVTEVAKHPGETVNFGGIWHSDTTYLPEPPMATMLIARQVPPAGGDTLFANQYLAYETLSAGMRSLLDGLIAINSSAKADTSRTREDRMRESAKDDVQQEYLAEHPVVRVHAETGRRSLYVNPAHTLRFKDMSEEESAPILGYLFDHQTKPEFTCRFSWGAGSIAFWDNRCTLHNPINDYQGYSRVMHRVTLNIAPSWERRHAARGSRT
jgi:taurine dioxygenase